MDSPFILNIFLILFNSIVIFFVLFSRKIIKENKKLKHVINFQDKTIKFYETVYVDNMIYCYICCKKINQAAMKAEGKNVIDIKYAKTLNNIKKER